MKNIEKMSLEELNQSYGNAYKECRKCGTYFVNSTSLMNREMCSHCWVNIMREGVNFPYYSQETDILFELYYWGNYEVMILNILKKLEKNGQIKEFKNFLEEEGKDQNVLYSIYKNLKHIFNNKIKGNTIKEDFTIKEFIPKENIISINYKEKEEKYYYTSELKNTVYKVFIKLEQLNLSDLKKIFKDNKDSIQLILNELQLDSKIIETDNDTYEIL